ncbi:MAG TPA: carbamoyltransferase C-terminal domain-containing protein [Mariprofundaceae bacterium]|nr:carbamoyltransferase C-terminal domain-containing protein [Mariprofundaceae bacterium]
MIILGINDGRYHNTAASVVVDGRVVASIEEERLSRIKMDNAYPHQAIDEALSIAGISAEEVDVVALSNLSRWDQRPYLNRLFRHMSKVAKHEPLIRQFYLKQQFQRFTRLLKPRRKPPGALAAKPVQTVEHHHAHAASAYYCSPFGSQRIGVITLDGSGDFSWGSVWVGEHGKLTPVEHLHALNSIGLLYSAVTVYLGFKATRHEGKVLGLAAFGNPEPFLSRLLAHVDANDWNHLLDARLARVTLRQFTSMGQDVIREMCHDLSREDVAAGIQALTERLICDWVRDQATSLGVDTLALAGGVFANVKLNQRILELPEISNIYIHPNMGDGGLATGAALEAYSRLNNGHEPQLLEQVYLGTVIDEANALAAINEAGVPFSKPENMAGEVGQLLADGKVVARAEGGMEYGPRALGNRTVMAACNDTDINDWLNKKFERTEFMPFAPVIMEEYAAEYFMHWSPEQVTARFMTITYDASELAKKNIPAAIHVDGTARPQVLRRQDNPDYYDIIRAYHAKTGVASVINTSFNMHEEPIVRTAEEAIRAFQAAKLDALILGPFLILA